MKFLNPLRILNYKSLRTILYFKKKFYKKKSNLNSNKIFVFEFASGGGFCSTTIPTSLLCEGFGMLRSIITDFKALEFEIHTTLDQRVFFLSRLVRADKIVEIKKNDNYLKVFKDLVKNCKYVFIIAPETSKILYKLTKIVKNYGRIILSTNLKGIEHGASKILSYKIFKKNKISTPKTYRIPYKKDILDKDFLLQKFRKLKSPIVIKPADGVGAESIHYFEKESQILNYIMEFNPKLEKKRKYVIQEFTNGRDLSISLIGSPFLYANPLVLSINSQNINIKNNQFDYLGGYTPLEDYKEYINQISINIKKIKNLQIEGYFGIDFIGNDYDSFTFIEINPRLTTSYIGLRNILNFNCAELIFNSKIKNINEVEIDLLAYSYFTRIDFNCSNFEKMELKHEDPIQRLNKIIPEFVTPPISLNEHNQYSCFIATKTKDLSSSKIRFNEIIQSLEDLNFNVLKPKKLIL